MLLQIWNVRLKWILRFRFYMAAPVLLMYHISPRVSESSSINNIQKITMIFLSWVWKWNKKKTLQKTKTTPLVRSKKGGTDQDWRSHCMHKPRVVNQSAQELASLRTWMKEMCQGQDIIETITFNNKVIGDTNAGAYTKRSCFRRCSIGNIGHKQGRGLA